MPDAYFHCFGLVHVNAFTFFIFCLKSIQLIFIECQSSVASHRRCCFPFDWTIFSLLFHSSFVMKWATWKKNVQKYCGQSYWTQKEKNALNCRWKWVQSPFVRLDSVMWWLNCMPSGGTSTAKAAFSGRQTNGKKRNKRSSVIETLQFLALIEI